MVHKCAVEGCNSYWKIAKVGYYVVPAIIAREDNETLEISTRRRRLWIARLGGNIDESKVNSATRVCGKHFVNGRPAKLREQDNVDWLPTIGVHVDIPAEDDSDTLDSISFRSETSSPIFWDCDVQMENERQVEVDVQGIGPSAGNNIQTDILNEDVVKKALYDQVLADNMSLRSEIMMLKEKFCEFNEEHLESDDSKVKFYTGLPSFKTLKYIYDFVSVKVDYTSRNCLSKFQEFMVIMLRLRLNLLEQDLAYRFGVTQGTICNIIDRWLRVMAIRLKKLIHWPEREVLQKTMPECFKAAFGNKVAVIIDCFEIFTEKASSLLPRAETWSQYKHHNTIKFLIGITPQGTVSFISRAWVGRASDKCITEHCEFLDHLLPGDIVLADRGFTIEESVGMYRAKLVIPAFTKGRAQLPSEEVQAMREDSNLRIHVERVIGFVKRKFKILGGIVPTDFLTPRGGDSESHMDHIITICCALANVCPSVVPLRSSDVVNDDE